MTLAIMRARRPFIGTYPDLVRNPVLNERLGPLSSVEIEVDCIVGRCSTYRSLCPETRFGEDLGNPRLRSSDSTLPWNDWGIRH